MELQYKVAAATIGCKVNQSDTEAILQTFADCGYEIVDFDQQADVYIVNTCTVTNTGDRKSRQVISRARARNQRAVVAVVGCYSQINPDAIRPLGVDIIMGTKDRDKLVRYVQGYKKFMGVLDLVNAAADAEHEFEPIFVERFSDRARAFLKIQDGCDNFCTYCVVPHARGPSRSRKPGDILMQAKAFAQNGYKEVVLCGIHVASFGKDLDGGERWDLLKIMREMEGVRGIERIRLSSVDPGVITPEFVAHIKGSDKICPHFTYPYNPGPMLF